MILVFADRSMARISRMRRLIPDLCLDSGLVRRPKRGAQVPCLNRTIRKTVFL